VAASLVRALVALTIRVWFAVSPAVPGQLTDRDDTAPETVNKDKVEVLVPLQPLCARFTLVPVAHVRAELWLMPELQPKKPTAGAHPERGEGEDQPQNKARP
jgi:hypothetical protein